MAQLPFINGATLGVIRANINSMFTEIYAAIAALGTRGAANGVASLGSDAKVPAAQMTGKLATTDLADGAALNTQVTTNTTAIASKFNVAIGWNGTTPALASSTNPITAGFGSNSFVYTGTGTSPALDGLSGVHGDIFVFGVGATSTWSKFAARTGVPITLATTHVFAEADDSYSVIATGTPGYVLNTGLSPGWGVSIKGAFTLTGTATVTDTRTTTGVAWCCLSQTDTTGAGATYDMVGTK